MRTANNSVCAFAFALFPMLSASDALAVTLQYVDFSSTTGLTLNGDAVTASTSDGSVLRLTSAITGQTGSAYSSTAINVSEFSTFFGFRITSSGGLSDGTGPGGDGLVFSLQSSGPSVLGGGGGGIGYGGTLNSLGAEFDTWRQTKSASDPSSWNDPSSNHLGVDTNGAMDSLVTAIVSPNFDDGKLWYAWIDYNGSLLEIRVNQTGVRPAGAVLSQAVDIPALLVSHSGFVGFTSATGGAFANHDLLFWEYRDRFDPIPEPGSAFLIGVGLAGLLWTSHRRRRDSRT
jgi:hypothetical protein